MVGVLSQPTGITGRVAFDFTYPKVPVGNIGGGNKRRTRQPGCPPWTRPHNDVPPTTLGPKPQGGITLEDLQGGITKPQKYQDKFSFPWPILTVSKLQVGITKPQGGNTETPAVNKKSQAKFTFPWPILLVTKPQAVNTKP